jgi:hypothetical protein
VLAWAPLSVAFGERADTADISGNRAWAIYWIGSHLGCAQRRMRLGRIQTARRLTLLSHTRA